MISVKPTFSLATGGAMSVSYAWNSCHPRCHQAVSYRERLVLVGASGSSRLNTDVPTCPPNARAAIACRRFRRWNWVDVQRIPQLARRNGATLVAVAGQSRSPMRNPVRKPEHFEMDGEASYGDVAKTVSGPARHQTA